MKKISTDVNPADVATQPNRTKEDKQRWLTGPSYLSNNSKSWPWNHRSDNFFLCGEGLTNKDAELDKSKDMQLRISQQPTVRQALGQYTLQSMTRHTIGQDTPTAVH